MKKYRSPKQSTVSPPQSVLYIFNKLLIPPFGERGGRGGSKVLKFTKLKKSFLKLYRETHYINIKIGHLSLKPLITPFGECRGRGGSKVENSPNWKILFLNDRETYDINIKILLFSKTINYPLWGVCGGSRGSKVENYQIGEKKL